MCVLTKEWGYSVYVSDVVKSSLISCCQSLEERGVLDRCCIIVAVYLFFTRTHTDMRINKNGIFLYYNQDFSFCGYIYDTMEEVLMKREKRP